MIAQKQDKKMVTVEVAEPVLEVPAYPPEFMNLMSSYAYNTLRRHLIQEGASKDVLDLLENLYQIMSIMEWYATDGEVEWHVNLSAHETVAAIAQEVVALGGEFILPDGSRMIARQ